MSQKSNPVTIGAFVLTALILAVGVIIYFGSFKLFSKNEKFILYFDESVNGLDVGAPVKFKGVNIGRVVKIYIRFNQPDENDKIPVIIELDLDLLANSLGVEIDLADEEHFIEAMNLGYRAQLVSESFITGLLFIEISLFKEASAPVYVQEKAIYKEIPTRPSALATLQASGAELIAQFSKLDVESIKESLVGLLEKANRALDQIDFAEINTSVIAAVKAAEGLLGSPEVKQLPTNVNETLTTFKGLATKLESKIDPVMSEARETNELLQQTLQRMQAVVARIDLMLLPESNFRYQLEHALSEVAEAAEAIRLLVEFIERNPNALITGKPPPES